MTHSKEHANNKNNSNNNSSSTGFTGNDIDANNSRSNKVADSRSVLSSYVLPPDTNNHGTLFGGKLMAYIDDVAARAAMRHARRMVVTASTDSIHFLHPIKVGHEVSLEAFVTWTHRTSMEVFVKIVGENLLTGNRMVCATSFLTYVALGEDGRPTEVPPIVPETAHEQHLHNTAPERAAARRQSRITSRQFIDALGTKQSGEQ